MQQRKRHSLARTSSAPKPGVWSLLMHIFRGTFQDGMQIPALFCIIMTFVLHHEQLPYHAAISALLITALVLIGLIRGCSNWQHELVEYRRHLAMLHYQETLSDKGHTIPGFVPFTRR